MISLGKSMSYNHQHWTNRSSLSHVGVWSLPFEVETGCNNIPVTGGTCYNSIQCTTILHILQYPYKQVMMHLLTIFWATWLCQGKGKVSTIVKSHFPIPVCSDLWSLNTSALVDSFLPMPGCQCQNQNMQITTWTHSLKEIIQLEKIIIGD